ncbi:MAG: carbon monoxide dehydrogenase subunit G [Hyphomicrobiales bacterium]|nr:carbon monoxide dehydrogenase subunit G [Hyphomicrobiales bacterium]
MQMNDEIRIAAPRVQVFASLNDPEILKACIPGCESLEKLSDRELSAIVMAKVGPVKARFKGVVTLSDLNPPESYTISGEGKGGAAGFAKGAAKVHLSEDGDGTLLRYEVKADVGGKLAQLGSRLVDGAARHYARDFFAAFKGRLEKPAEAVPELAPAEAAPARAASRRLWIVLAAAIVIALIVAYALS